MSRDDQQRLREARVQVRKEFAELARIYSAREKNDPLFRTACEELQSELEESIARIEEHLRQREDTLCRSPEKSNFSSP